MIWELPEALSDLRGERVWVAWDDEGGRKVPKSYRGGNASVSDPTTWGTYDEASVAMLANGYSGVGIMLSGGYTGIDLDNVIDDNGELLPWARKLVESVNSYAEVSPSGAGIHIIAWADPEVVGAIGKNDKANGIEIYNNHRYFTVTGNAINDEQITNATEQVDGIMAELNRVLGSDEVAAAVATLVADQVRRMANDTIVNNAARDDVRFARVPSGRETCGFCLMLASRGPVYHSEYSAGELNHYHRHCDCRVVPWFGDTEVEGYDPDALLDIYTNAYYEELGGRNGIKTMWADLSSADKAARIRRHGGSERDAFEAFSEERISEVISEIVYGTSRPFR